MPIIQADVDFILAAVKHRFLSSDRAIKLLKELRASQDRDCPSLLDYLAVSSGYLTKEQAEQLRKEHIESKNSKTKVSRIASYDLKRKIGSGSMGVVYDAVDTRTGVRVAFKILLKRFYDDPDYLTRFYNEAKLGQQFTHPNIVRVFEAGKSAEGYHFMVMEYVDGRTALEMLEQTGAFPECHVVGIALQTASAIDCLSRHDVVHRDIKPDNIMLAADGVVKVTDLGLAWSPDVSSIEVRGIALGTPHYMSPEQVRGEEVNVRSDLYSLGATMFHLATGVPVFTGSSAAVIITKHLSEAPRSPKELNPSLSGRFCDIILKLLQKKPGDRYQTPQELVQELECMQAGEGKVAVSVGQAGNQ